jgi:hypothetical protein
VTLALVLGSALAVAALAWVLLPILRPSPEPQEPDLLAAAAGARLSATTALETLREIEFDEATGKLSPEDYAILRARYTPLAVAELEAEDRARAAALVGAGAPEGAATGGASVAVDPAEALIARAKARALACPACGPRPESDALFCSDCGRYLAAACLHCGAAVESPDARFCTGCGASLAA